MSKAKKQEQTNDQTKRVFSTTTKIFVDTFKLLPAPVIKRVGLANHPNENPQDFAQFEHTHVFRSRDERGNAHTKCVPIGGHFHEVVLEHDQNDPTAAPTIVAVSGPMRLVKKRVHGRMVAASEPLNDYDDHTHDALYLNTSEMQRPVTNIEAQKVIAQEAQKGAPVAGVVER